MKVLKPERMPENGIINFTYQLKKGEYTLDYNSDSPVQVLAGNDSLFTQADVVTRHSDGSAALIHVHADISGSEDGQTQLTVYELPPSDDVTNGTQLTEAVLGFVARDRAAVLYAEDMHGNRYWASITRKPRDIFPGGDTNTELDLFGPLTTRAFMPSHLLPTTQALEHPDHMPHFGLMQVFMQASAGTEAVKLDVSWSNGDVDTPLGPLFFKRLTLLIAPGWHMQNAWPMPAQAMGIDEYESYTEIDLIAPSVDGRLHALAASKHASFSFVLYHEDSKLAADDMNVDAGWTSCPDSFRQKDGRNGWGSMNFPLLKEFHSSSSIHGRITNRTNDALVKYASGKQISPLGGDDMVGPYHYDKPNYGGVTGGTGKDFSAVTEEVVLGRAFGLRYWRMRVHGTMQRMDDFDLFGSDGRPFDMKPFTGKKAPWKFFDGFQKKNWPEKAYDMDTPFGIYETWPVHAPNERIKERSQLPPGDMIPKYWNRSYYDALHNGTGYMSIDHQHLIRAFGMCDGLIHAVNDPMAKMRAKQLAQRARMAYWEGPGGRLENYTKGTKGIGADLGRGPGHAIHSVLLAWMIQDDEWRDDHTAFFETVVDAHEHQLMSTGSCLAARGGKPINEYDFNKQFAVGRFNGGMWDLCGFHSIGQHISPLSQRVHDHLAHSLIVGYLGHQWTKSQTTGEYGKVAWTHIAHGPRNSDEASEMFSPENHPVEQFSSGYDSFGVQMCFAMAVTHLGSTHTIINDRMHRHLGSLNFEPVVRAKSKDWGLQVRYGLLGVLQNED